MAIQAIKVFWFLWGRPGQNRHWVHNTINESGLKTHICRGTHTGRHTHTHTGTHTNIGTHTCTVTCNCNLLSLQQQHEWHACNHVNISYAHLTSLMGVAPHTHCTLHNVCVSCHTVGVAGCFFLLALAGCTTLLQGCNLPLASRLPPAKRIGKSFINWSALLALVFVVVVAQWQQQLVAEPFGIKHNERNSKPVL